jgi:hypothetical protein
MRFIVSLVLGCFGYSLAVEAFGRKGFWAIVLLIASQEFWKEACEKAERKARKRDREKTQARTL